MIPLGVLQIEKMSQHDIHERVKTGDFIIANLLRTGAAHSYVPDIGEHYKCRWISYDNDGLSYDKLVITPVSDLGKKMYFTGLINVAIDAGMHPNIAFCWAAYKGNNKYTLVKHLANIMKDGVSICAFLEYPEQYCNVEEWNKKWNVPIFASHRWTIDFRNMLAWIINGGHKHVTML